jgi:hypothetical protein
MEKIPTVREPMQLDSKGLAKVAKLTVSQKYLAAVVESEMQRCHN